MTGKELGRQPAYPCTSDVSTADSGLSKREDFAKAAMTGLLANPEVGFGTLFELSQRCVGLADALLDALAAKEAT